MGAMPTAHNRWLILGASLSALAGLLHLACIVFGASWYRFLGAGERMARMAEMGHWYPIVATLVIATILLIWSLYALSGAGVIRRLPLLRLGLCTITIIYIARGVGVVAIMPLFSGHGPLFWATTSGICLVLGLVHLRGLQQRWRYL